jgi:hypothetical protein
MPALIAILTYFANEFPLWEVSVLPVKSTEGNRVIVIGLKFIARQINGTAVLARSLTPFDKLEENPDYAVAMIKALFRAEMISIQSL